MDEIKMKYLGCLNLLAEAYVHLQHEPDLIESIDMAMADAERTVNIKVIKTLQRLDIEIVT